MTNFIALTELEKLFDLNYVRSNKIYSIKTIRTITGTSLREAKDFFEDVVLPTLEGKNSNLDPNELNPGDPLKVINPPKEENLPPPMFLIGHVYRQLDKQMVLILGATNQNTSYETVFTADGNGDLIHRYNRRDFGRVTGTDSDNPDPRNLENV